MRQRARESDPDAQETRSVMRKDLLEQLKQAAEKLEGMLKDLAPKEPAAARCLKVLSPTFARIKAGVDAPCPRAPCGYDFHEGDLRKYRDLEAAYSLFSVLVTGKDPEVIRRIVRDL
jgi:hypothetical protein